MPQDTQPGDLPRISKMIDPRIPLTWILGIAGMVAAAFVSTYYQVGQLRGDMVELKATVRQGNSQSATVQSELSILKYRIETLELDKRNAK